MKKKLLERIDWPTTLFLILVPLFAIVATPLSIWNSGIDLNIVIFSVIFAVATNLSITAGYHRLYAHRSYEANPFVKAIFLLVGASAWQGSCLKWSFDHRIHHSKIDTDEDPYSISKGFWYAHMGWLFLNDSTSNDPRAADLEKDILVRLQHRFYYLTAIAMGFGFPTLVGWFLGSAWEGFLIGGALRITLTQQSTFFVNSLCHTLGKKPYSAEISARDSFIVAVLTHGEGYHNFHHTFQLDYRNGIKWYQWDPTKWTIRTLAFVGLAKKLKRISQREILKAKLQLEEAKIYSKGISEVRIQQLRENIILAHEKIRKMKEEYQRLKSTIGQSEMKKLRDLGLEIRLAKIEFSAGLKQWKTYLKV